MDIVAIPYAAIRQFLRRVPRFFIGVFQHTFPQKSVSPRAIRGPIPLSPRELLGTGRGTGPTEKNVSAADRTGVVQRRRCARNQGTCDAHRDRPHLRATEPLEHHIHGLNGHFIRSLVNGGQWHGQ